MSTVSPLVTDGFYVARDEVRHDGTRLLNVRLTDRLPSLEAARKQLKRLAAMHPEAYIVENRVRR